MSASEKGPERGGRAAQAATLLRTVGGRLFRNDDTRAREHGWEVSERHGGLSRVYRDPRFDLLQVCPACRDATAGQRDRACDSCSGSGRVTLAARPQPEAGRGR
jgi:hypothetical protein